MAVLSYSVLTCFDQNWILTSHGLVLRFIDNIVSATAVESNDRLLFVLSGWAVEWYWLLSYIRSKTRAE